MNDFRRNRYPNIQKRVNAFILWIVFLSLLGLFIMFCLSDRGQRLMDGADNAGCINTAADERSLSNLLDDMVVQGHNAEYMIYWHGRFYAVRVMNQYQPPGD